MDTDRSTAERVDEGAEVLQDVVCPPDLAVAAMVDVLPELEPLICRLIPHSSSSATAQPELD